MPYRQQIHDDLAAHRGEIVALMKKLVRIPSVRGEAAPGAPFGQACRDALEFVKSLAEAEGLTTTLDAEGGYLLAEYGEGTRSLGLFAHADVVPVGDDWMYTALFEPLEKDGFLIGRGVIDDKAAIAVALLCVKLLRELSIPFHSRLVLFTGANEESGMQDIKNYLAAHRPPDFSLVCDTAFPLYYGNKGRILFTAASGMLSDAFRAFTGGSGGTVIGAAEARLAPDAAMLDWLKSRETADLTVSAEDGEILLRAVGIARHSALPEGSRNAAGMLTSLLAECPLLPESDRAILRFAAAITAAYDGSALGIASDDPPFGRLTCVCTACRLQEHRLTLDFN
ncbi:MAG: M20/M25/M40 family metallo-hydrolase, partial [Clostridia bacterium]|nr:M20/M25/M40 family metallo-hydrolase [Clostridia bacterium]